jgi:hypothetical protein
MRICPYRSGIWRAGSLRLCRSSAAGVSGPRRCSINGSAKSAGRQVADVGRARQGNPAAGEAGTCAVLTQSSPDDLYAQAAG